MVGLNPSPFQLVIADDNERFRDTLAELFCPYFEITQVGTGQDVVDYVSQEKVHLALLDYEMPELSGIEAAIELKEQHDTPSILLTARNLETIPIPQPMPMFRVFNKPVRRRELFGCVQEVMTSCYGIASLLPNGN